MAHGSHSRHCAAAVNSSGSGRTEASEKGDENQGVEAERWEGPTDPVPIADSRGQVLAVDRVSQHPFAPSSPVFSQTP